MVTLTNVVDVFREQEIQHGDHLMDVMEVIHALSGLFERLEEERGVAINVPLCVDMCLNWLLNVYDRCNMLRTAMSGPIKGICQRFVCLVLSRSTYLSSHPRSELRTTSAQHTT